MDELHFLSVDDLKLILAWLIGMNGDVRERDGELLYFPRKRRGMSLEISLQAIETLVEELRVVTVLTISSDPAQVASLLASVAMIIGQTGPKVTRPAASDFANKFGAEFGVVSAAYLARVRGYVIQPSKLPWDDIYQAIRHQDMFLLTRIFEETLGVAQFSSEPDRAGRAARPEQDQDETEALMQYYESQFVGDDSMRYISGSIAGRELSAESYWNLRSVGEMEGWDSETVLGLIDEHLHPSLQAGFVYHNTTVSGSDWLRLHIWMHGQGGAALWGPAGSRRT